MLKYHIVSFSGGKDSTAMLLHMLELNYKIDEVITCDTGVEFSQMYNHIEKIKKIVKCLGIKFTTLKSEKSFEYLLIDHVYKKGAKKGYSWARPRSRWCTTQLKTNIIKNYIKSLEKQYDVIQYVGLAYDEMKRIKRKGATNHIHPLSDWRWTEKMALEYCYSKGYDWGGLYRQRNRVSCWCCPLQDLKGLRDLYHHHKELWHKLKQWETKTRTQFRIDYSLNQLEVRFEIEKNRLGKGLSINPHNREFRKTLAKIKST